MADIVEWLRESDEPLLDDYREVCAKYSATQPNRLLEAADEIVALRATKVLPGWTDALRQARDAALEEAAQVCSLMEDRDNFDCAAAIRALKRLRGN